jgi:uncharacterized protein VirK/YbjX
MPKYEVTRSYTVACVATVEAESVDQAKRVAFEYDLFWKEHDGDYHTEVDVEEITDECS